MSEWQSDITYEDGDEIIHTPRKIVFLTGFAWLWAKLTGKPTQWTEEGKPQVWVVLDTPLDREDFEEMDWQPLASGNDGGATAEQAAKGMRCLARAMAEADRRDPWARLLPFEVWRKIVLRGVAE